MKVSKRIVALVLSLMSVVIFSFAYVFSASAAGKNIQDGGEYYPVNNLLYNSSVSSSGTPLSKNNYFSNVSADMTANYYNQLDTDQKNVYDGLKTLTPSSASVNITLAAPITFTSATVSPTSTEEQPATDKISSMTQAAFDALLRDYPEIFWLKFGSGGSKFQWSMQSSYNGTDYTWTISKITFTPVIADSYASTASSDYTTLKNTISNFPISGNTRYLQLKSIHDSLASLITYNKNATHPYDAYGALIDHQAVCEGYSEAFKLLCDRENIPCILVSGTGVTTQGTEAHMWAYVQMDDGIWYAVDVTWDDQVTVTYTDFFLTGANAADPDYGAMTFSSSHLANGVFSSNGKAFTYPPLSSTAYVPTTYDLTGTPTTTTTSTSATTTSTTTAATTTMSAETTTTTSLQTTDTSSVPTTTTTTSASTTAASTEATTASTTDVASAASTTTSTTVNVPAVTTTTSASTTDSTTAVSSSSADATTTSTITASNDSSASADTVSASASDTTATTTNAGLLSSVTNPVTGESAIAVCAAVILAVASGVVIALKKK